MIRRWLPLALLYIGLIATGWVISEGASDFIATAVDARQMSKMMWMVGLICAFYMLASAIPFVPGAEIGLALIAVFGARAALLVYLCMVFALGLSYLTGRLVQARWIAALFTYLKLHQATRLVDELAELPPHECQMRVRRHVTNGFLRGLLGYRYLALAFAINLPGNTALGGGGGLALFAGMSRLFSPLGFLVTVLVAVAPIPLTVFMMGYQP